MSDIVVRHSKTFEPRDVIHSIVRIAKESGSRLQVEGKDGDMLDNCVELVWRSSHTDCVFPREQECIDGCVMGQVANALSSHAEAVRLDVQEDVWLWVGKEAPSMHQILPNLWLGAFSALENKAGLQASGVRHNINLSCSRPSWADQADPSIQSHNIDIMDDKRTDLRSHLEPCIRLIDAALQANEGILINCMQGRSRSGAILIAYLMKHHGHNYKSALKLCRSIRKCVKPNAGFRHQLCTGQLLPK